MSFFLGRGGERKSFFKGSFWGGSGRVRSRYIYKKDFGFLELFRFFWGRLFVFLDSRRMWLESRWRIIETAVLSDRFISSVPASQETNFSWLATSEGINVVID